MGVFEGILLMRVTTVARVTEQNDFFRKYIRRRKQILRSLFDRYIIIHHTTHPNDPSNFTQKQQQSTKRSIRRVRSTFPKREPPRNKNSYYELYLIVTSSFTPRNALTIPSPHFTSTTSNKTLQPTRTEHFPRHRFLSLLRSCTSDYV